jgi:glycosyltransferase involved in cell wall biosynthesis
MKISTITVCYNSARTIGHTVASFLEQDYPDKEMIVVDGASKDETLDIVRSFSSDQIRIHSAPDKGVYDAMNKGIDLFSGDAAGFLNSDDRYHDASALSAIAESLPTCDVVSGNIVFVKDHETDTVVRTWRSTAFSKGAFRKGWIVPHPAVYARREVFETVGKFDLSLRVAADYDWILRALEVHGFRHAVLYRTLVHMQMGGASTSGLKVLWTNAVEPLRSRQKWLNAGAVDYAFFAKNLKKIGQLLPR